MSRSEKLHLLCLCIDMESMKINAVCMNEIFVNTYCIYYENLILHVVTIKQLGVRKTLIKLFMQLGTQISIC